MSSLRILSLLGIVWCLGGSMQVYGQVSRLNRHSLLRSDLPPGLIGVDRIQKAGHQVGRYQAIRLEGPPSCRFALASANTFEVPERGSKSAAVLIGPAYRFKVTDIPDQPGLELFPTVEVIDHLCPPPGLEASFPIPIHLSQSDLDLAANGHMVTRVVYLEDPQTALPIAEKPGVQRVFDVTGTDDPLHVADELGKPMAIVRIGSRVAPDRPEQMHEFLLGCPPWIPIYPIPAPDQTSTQSVPIGMAGFPRPVDSNILRR